MFKYISGKQITAAQLPQPFIFTTEYMIIGRMVRLAHNEALFSDVRAALAYAAGKKWDQRHVPQPHPHAAGEVTAKNLANVQAKNAIAPGVSREDHVARASNPDWMPPAGSTLSYATLNDPLHADSVSRFHALVRRDAGGGFSIKDLNSLNGVFLNGIKMRSDVEWAPLYNGMRVRFAPLTPTAKSVLNGSLIPRARTIVEPLTGRIVVDLGLRRKDVHAEYVFVGAPQLLAPPGGLAVPAIAELKRPVPIKKEEEQDEEPIAKRTRRSGGAK